MPCFSSTFGKNSITHSGPILGNTLISTDKNFANISYEELKRKTRSVNIFEELTFKETSTTTTNFRRKDFTYNLRILEFLMMYINSLVRVVDN